MFTTIWWPGKPDRPWLIYLIGGCLLAAACFGLWRLKTNTPMLISGKVLDVQGHPVTLARVYVAEGPGTLPDIAALSNTQGEFSIAVTKPGTYQVGCTADGFSPARASVDVTPNQHSSVTFTLTQP